MLPWEHISWSVTVTQNIQHEVYQETNNHRIIHHFLQNTRPPPQSSHPAVWPCRNILHQYQPDDLNKNHVVWILTINKPTIFLLLMIENIHLDNWKDFQDAINTTIDILYNKMVLLKYLWLFKIPTKFERTK